MKLPIDTSGQLAWVIANTEACLSESNNIQPIHFWLGILKLLDEHIPKALNELELTGDKRACALCVIRQVGGYLEISQQRATRLRRTIRKKLRQGVVMKDPEKIEALHRSDEMREVFGLAGEIAHRNGDKSISLYHITQALFDSGKITLKNFKSEASSKPGSDGAQWKLG
jgi:hypothetical protein